MAPAPVTLPRHVCDALGLAAHEVAFREGSATIVLPSKQAAFLNPVQEFNRDLSVLAIRAWSDLRNEEKREKFIESHDRRQRRVHKRKAKKQSAADVTVKKSRGEEAGSSGQEAPEKIASTSDHSIDIDDHAEQAQEPARHESSVFDTEPSMQVEEYKDYRIRILEALSATGLRSIRYAREIPLLRTVIANDLSRSAIEAMKRNVAMNFPAGRPIEPWLGKTDAKASEDVLEDLENNAEAARKESNSGTNGKSTTSLPTQLAVHPHCKVQIREQDANALMYSNREEKQKFDVVDLDPYGSAVTFLDGAVQCLTNGGLLCVTCTDMAVLAATTSPEKTYSAYGGVTAKAGYSHEIALRLVLHAIASSAARYGYSIEPLLSLSIDFYVRIFVRLHQKPIAVKKLASNTGLVFVCSGCQSYHPMPLGRNHPHEYNGQTLDKFQPGLGPTMGTFCDQCSSKFHVAGPMWLGPLHDPAFCQRMSAIVHAEPQKFGTSARIKGMVAIAGEELNGQDTLFFFTPSKLSSLFHCIAPSLAKVVSALLHAGHRVSRSHCQPGSVKTDATRAQVYDLYRAWIANDHEVKLENVSKTSPTYHLLTKESQKTDWNLTDTHPDAQSIIEGHARQNGGVLYQQNPLKHWGPGSAASRGSGGGSTSSKSTKRAKMSADASA